MDDFEDTLAIWKRFVLGNWSYFDAFARENYMKHGPGAVTIDMSKNADSSFFASKSHGYVTKDAAKREFSTTVATVFALRVTEVPPTKQITFWLWQSEGEMSVVWEQAKLKDGSAKRDINLDWYKRERTCPKCGTSFVSVQCKGRCPNCSHVFFAEKLFFPYWLLAIHLTHAFFFWIAMVDVVLGLAVYSARK